LIAVLSPEFVNKETVTGNTARVGCIFFVDDVVAVVFQNVARRDFDCSIAFFCDDLGVLNEAIRDVDYD